MSGALGCSHLLVVVDLSAVHHEAVGLAAADIAGVAAVHAACGAQAEGRVGGEVKYAGMQTRCKQNNSNEHMAGVRCSL